ncbi:MAG: hypothetical protein QXS37_05960 [Candidatus Aenigmatarchaeota archaeon]
MIPVKDYLIVNFFIWLRNFHPYIFKFIWELSDIELQSLCREFIEGGFWRQYDFMTHPECKRCQFKDENFEIITWERLYYSVKSLLKRYKCRNETYKASTGQNKNNLETLGFLIPYNEIVVVRFLEWLSEKHPEIDLLANIPNEILNSLVNEFINGNKNQLKPTPLFENLIKLKKGEYFRELYEKLLERNIKEKKKNSTYIEGVDMLRRYKTVPLHAIFLYSSQHSYVQDYILKHWGALSSMSGDYCDIYFSIDQLYYEEDAFDVIEQIKAEIDITKLPGILFWEKDLSKKYFLSFKKLDEKSFERDLTDLLFKVFQQIRKSPGIDSIKSGETLFIEEYEAKKTSFIVPTPQITINVETLIGDVVGVVQGDLIKNKENQQLLTDILKSMEWNEENKKRIERLEQILKSNEEAVKEVNLLIERLVEANIDNKNFLERLKNFAINILTNFYGSLLANSILNVLPKT